MHCVCAQSCLTGTPSTAALQAPPSMEFSRQEYWSRLPFPSPGDLLDPGIKSTSFVSPALEADSLPLCHLGRSPLLCGVVVQLLSCVRLFATPWTAALQASLSFTISQRLLKLMSIELVMPSNHLIFCRPLLLLPSIFPSIRVFPNELALRIRCFLVYCFVVFYPKSILWPDPSVVPTFGHLWMFTL